MRIATGFIEKRRSVELTLKCDRCGAVASVLDNATLAQWVCCHKIFTNHAHMPPRVLPDLAEGVSEVIPVLDELHVCGECWRLVEAAVQPTKPPPPPAGVHHDIGSLCTLPHCPHPHRPAPVVGSGRYA